VADLEAPLRLRRLARARELPYLHRQPWPLFDAARRHEAVRPLGLGLHSRGLAAVDHEQEGILAQLALSMFHRAYTLIRSPGEPAAWMGRYIPAFELRTNDDTGDVGATLTSDESITYVGNMFRERWEYLARGSLHDVARWRDLAELELLAHLGADIVVTLDPQILAIRNDPLLQGLNVMTPEEAFLLAGVWSRVVHNAFCQGPVTYNNGLYYWALTRALTPASWPGYCAFVRMRWRGDDGPVLLELASSILDHLTAINRALDRLVVLWQCDTSNDTISELFDEFERVVLGTWAVYDNVALLAGTYFGISLTPRTAWNVRDKGWRKAVEGTGEARARSLAQLIRADQPRFEASEQIRHQLAHRARLSPVRQITGSGGRQEEEPRIWLSGEAFVAFENALARMGVSPDTWGVAARLPAGKLKVNEVSEGPSVWIEVDREAQALVDPVVLAIRLASHAAGFANASFRILDPLSDPRMPDRSLCAGAPSEEWATPQAASLEILSSPLSGLI
jgi:hypothetical protein